MKKITLLALILLSQIIFAEAVFSQEVSGWKYNEPKDAKFEKTKSNKNIKLPEKAAKYFEGMQLIPGGTFTMGNTINSSINDEDTTLLINGLPRRVSISDFYLCNHEVTNAEYREFVNYVRDYICLLTIAEYDDTYYLDKELKIIDFSKRNEIFNDEENLERLVPLFIKGEKFYRIKDIDTELLTYNGIKIYPDTLCWLREFPYSYSEPMYKNYFSHPAYNNYPVVGVSWKQAQAYCKWRSDLLNENILREKGILNLGDKRIGSFSTEVYLTGGYNSVIEKFSKNAKKGNINSLLMPRFNLPTEAEWEYAALGPQNNNKDIIAQKRLLPWNGYLTTDKKGKYLANFGPVIEKSGYWVKQFDENIDIKGSSIKNYMYTAPVKSFPSNDFGLYDMAGNVAEWVLDVARPYTFGDDYLLFQEDKSYSRKKFIDFSDSTIHDEENKSNLENTIKKKDNLIVSADDNINTAMNKVLRRLKLSNEAYSLDTNKVMDRERLKYFAKIELHDAKVMAANPNSRIVKGGSWHNGISYMVCSSHEACSENKSRCGIGFRVAMIVMGDE